MRLMCIVFVSSHGLKNNKVDANSSTTTVGVNEVHGKMGANSMY